LSPKRIDVTESVEAWSIPVAGQRITRVCADYASVGLLASNGVYMNIEASFTYLGSSGIESALDPDGDAMDLAPMLRLRRLGVTECVAFKDGRLDVKFEDESRIQVPMDPEFEAWEICGPGGVDGLKITSMPGGGLAIWRDRQCQLSAD
jgi:Family of unknown function (DUF6188)